MEILLLNLSDSVKNNNDNDDNDGDNDQFHCGVVKDIDDA